MQKRLIPFKIVHLDSLGQGVSKETDKITFVSKTLPGETGTAEIMAEKKGVAFARLNRLQEASPNRIPPLCPHFEHCPSCHFLHTGYPEELQFKASSLEKLLARLPHPPLQVVPAPQRVGYRNRIQLHYNLRTQALGLLDAASDSILPVPHCLLGIPPVMEEIKRLYFQDQWKKEVPASQQQGHVEIYFFEEQIKVTWNGPYASGGFTQVYQAMNQALKQKLSEWMAARAPLSLLDLFAGNGNLSQHLPYSQRLCVDMYPEKPAGSDFISQNLYARPALASVERELKRRQLRPDLLLLDPPRSGLKDLAQWVKQLNPRYIAYVSCDPHTLVRDISSLNDYTCSQVCLLDFFPATWHFETLLILEQQA